MGNIKQIQIKTRTHYFFDNLINIKKFASNFLKTEKTLYKNIYTRYIGYIPNKYFYYVNIHSVNPLHFIIDNVDEEIEEKMEINT